MRSRIFERSAAGVALQPGNARLAASTAASTSAASDAGTSAWTAPVDGSMSSR